MRLSPMARFRICSTANTPIRQIRTNTSIDPVADISVKICETITAIHRYFLLTAVDAVVWLD